MDLKLGRALTVPEIEALLPEDRAHTLLSTSTSASDLRARGYVSEIRGARDA